MERQLAKWGLTLKDAEALSWEECDTAEAGLPSKRAIRIPYFSPLDTSRQLIARNGVGFIRYRILPHEYVEKVTGTKYMQVPNTGVEAYYSPILDWEVIVNDPTIGVVITEGEAKAARVCKEGIPCIGLGGVWSFQSLKNGIIFAKSLKAVNWRSRVVTIIYDTDIASNIQVSMAANALANALIDHGAMPYIAFIPDAGAEKVGIDDFVNIHGIDALVKLLSNAVPIGAAEGLMQLNTKYALVRSIGVMVNLDTNVVMTPGTFATVVEASTKVVTFHINKSGEQEPRVVSGAKSWIEWPLRNEVESITYEPGLPMLYDDKYNSWKGWGVVPKTGDVSPFIELLDYMFLGKPDEMKWFLQWLAYPIQNPGTKLFTAAVLYSTFHGTGKSFLGQIIGKLYGPNYCEIKTADLKNGFNYWAENKQFILGDEITGSDARVEADNLKKLITQEELHINKKHVPEYTIRDCINFLFTTNHPDAFFIEDYDRRFFIHQVVGEPLTDAFYERLHDFVFEQQGAQYIMDYLLNFDCTGFNPRARALVTQAKLTMMESSLSDVAAWVRTFKSNPMFILNRYNAYRDRDCFLAAELLRLYDPGSKTKVTATGMMRELQRAGVPMLFEGRSVATKRGFGKIFCVLNVNQWVVASVDQVIDHIGTLAPEENF